MTCYKEYVGVNDVCTWGDWSRACATFTPLPGSFLEHPRESGLVYHKADVTHMFFSFLLAHFGSVLPFEKCGGSSL